MLTFRGPGRSPVGWPRPKNLRAWEGRRGQEVARGRGAEQATQVNTERSAGSRRFLPFLLWSLVRPWAEDGGSAKEEHGTAERGRQYPIAAVTADCHGPFAMIEFCR